MTSENSNEKNVVEAESTSAVAEDVQKEPKNGAAQDVKPETEQEIEDKTPKKFLRYSKTESVIRIIMALVFAVFLLFFAFVLGMWTSDEGWVPLFNVDLFNASNLASNLGFLVIIWTAIIIIAEIIKSIIGRYVYPMAITALVGNIIVMCTVGIVFFHSNIMNPRFFERLGEAFEGGIPPFVDFVFGSANIIVIAVVYVILIVETVKIWLKAIKYS